MNPFGLCTECCAIYSSKRYQYQCIGFIGLEALSLSLRQRSMKVSRLDSYNIIKVVMMGTNLV